MPVDIVEVDEFTTAITVPESGDDRKAASVVPGFQALANRTLHLKNHAAFADDDNAFTGDNTHTGTELFTGPVRFGAAIEPSYDTPRTRVVMLSLDAYQSYGSSGGFTGGGIALQSQAAGDVVVIPVHLPRGAVVTGVRFGFVNGNAAAATISHGFYRTIPDKTTPSSSTTTALWGAGPSVAGGGTNLVSPSGTLAVTIDNEASSYFVQVSTTQPQTYVAWVELTYNDPGPRNG